MELKKCEKCKQEPATIHLTYIMNGDITAMHFCEKCAKERGIVVAAGSESARKESRDGDIACPECGITLAEVREKGWLGCARCYRAFAKDIQELLIELHGTDAHKGKRYRDFEADIIDYSDIQRLRRELENAVRNEQFETAAALRDKINQIKSVSCGEDSINK